MKRKVSLYFIPLFALLLAFFCAAGFFMSPVSAETVTEPSAAETEPAPVEEPAPVSEADRPESYPLGDVDHSRTVTAADARRILRAAVSLEEIAPELLPYADLDFDGKLSAADARLALRLAVGLSGPEENHEFTVADLSPATCAAEGKETYVCAVCQKSGDLVVPTLPHRFGEAAVTPATCAKAGKEERVCLVCGTKSVSVLPKKAHSYAFSGGKLRCENCAEKAQGFAAVNSCVYFAENGIPAKSWTEVGGEYYFFDRDTGVRQKDTVVDGIPLDKNGRAAADEVLEEKIRTFIKAKRILASITDPDDSRETKRYKAFQWVASFPYYQFRQVGLAMHTPGFESLFANDIFDRGMGCCGSTSYAFAFLSVEAGFKDVIVVDDGVDLRGHAWTAMEGSRKVYDVIFAQAYGFSKNYDAIPDDYRYYHPRETYVGG